MYYKHKYISGPTIIKFGKFLAAGVWKNS